MVKQKKKYIWNPACMDWSPGVAVLRLANEATAASFWSGCLLAGGWPEAGHAGHAGHLGIDVKVDPVQIGWSSWLLEIGCWFGVSNKVARMKIDKKAMWIWMWSSDFKSLRLYFLDCSNPSNIEKKILYFELSPPWHLYVWLLAYLLAFYLPYLLQYVLAYLLALYLAYLLAYLLTFYLAFYLANLLAYVLANILALNLAYHLTFYLAFYLANILAFYLANIMALYLAYLLAFYLAYLLAFYLAYLLAYVLAYLLALYLAYLVWHSF